MVMLYEKSALDFGILEVFTYNNIKIRRTNIVKIVQCVIFYARHPLRSCRPT